VFCRYCGKALAGSNKVCFSCGAEPVRSKGSCPHCRASTMPLARRCSQCGAKLKWKPSRARRRAIYDPRFDLSDLAPEQKDAFMQHRIDYAFSVDALLLLHFVTLGLFSLIYFGLMHSRLPMIKYDDFRAKRAIGFSFIPFFNLYWIFRFWLRLVDRLGLQTRFRGFRLAIPESLMRATIIVSLIPVAWFAALIMYPVCIAQIQSSCNELVPEESGRYRPLPHGP